MLTLQQAAIETGKAKSTIFRAIRSGRLSAARTDSGNFQIDPAELFRVFEPVPVAQIETVPAIQNGTGLERENALLRDQLAETRRDRDAWKEQAQRLALVPPPRRSSWWKVFAPNRAA